MAGRFDRDREREKVWMEIGDTKMRTHGHASLACLVNWLDIEHGYRYGMRLEIRWYTSEHVKSAYTWFAKLDAVFLSVGFSYGCTTIGAVYFTTIEAH